MAAKMQLSGIPDRAEGNEGPDTARQHLSQQRPERYRFPAMLSRLSIEKAGDNKQQGNNNLRFEADCLHYEGGTIP